MASEVASLPKRYLRAVQVAEALSIGRSTVYDWVDAGRLPAIRVGRVLLFPIDAVARALAELEEVDAGEADLVERLMRFQLAQASDRRPDLCPRCSAHPIAEDSKFGWCASCSTDRQIELDAAAERERARKRRWWAENGKRWDEETGRTSHHKKKTPATEASDG